MTTAVLHSQMTCVENSLSLAPASAALWKSASHHQTLGVIDAMRLKECPRYKGTVE